ncbi:MAG: hypothetical protein SFU86_11730 [Pirellulaceae bacterium]|nr:hypothetical protein [Pirellulaceae bacterium]
MSLRWTGCEVFSASLVVLAGWSCLVLAGCENAGSGPTRYPVSGNVTFDGQPVPKGFITFEPDADAGNSGPGGGAPIENGRYSTGLEAGVVGGAYTVKIVGYDGVPTQMEGETLADGQPLFVPYQTKVEFAKEKAEKNFEVPKQ